MTGAKRIWELDAFRGLCILGMTGVHLRYDLAAFYQLAPWTRSPLFAFVKDWGGVLFLLLSGLCATLGTRTSRRGLIVFGCGMVCTAVTWGLYRLGLLYREAVIRFGILHCLGCCMLLWPCFRQCATRWLLLLGAVLTATGLSLRGVVVSFSGLEFLGLATWDYLFTDYFPLLPNLGFFLLGAVLGRTLYRDKRSLLPQVNAENPVLRFFRFCGRQSLLIYLLHQPVLMVLLTILLRRIP